MTQARSEMLLHLGEHGWKATFTEPKGKEIAALFDTSTILTAYTASCPLATVIAELQARNPDCHVRHWNS
jgi:hypothetical protein